METQDQVFQQIKQAGEALKPGLWLPQDLDTLQAIAQDVVDLEAKADLAEKGQEGWRPPVIGPNFPPINPPVFNPVAAHPPVAVHPVAVHPVAMTTANPITTTGTIAHPMVNPLALQALTAVAPQHAEQIKVAVPAVEVAHLYVRLPVPPDPARAAMYRAAAQRALDGAANLALIRLQGQPTAVDQLRDRFMNALGAGLGGLLAPAAAAPVTPPSN